MKCVKDRPLPAVEIMGCVVCDFDPKADCLSAAQADPQRSGTCRRIGCRIDRFIAIKRNVLGQPDQIFAFGFKVWTVECPELGAKLPMVDRAWVAASGAFLPGSWHSAKSPTPVVMRRFTEGPGHPL